jgi:hypothetical protein
LFVEFRVEKEKRERWRVRSSEALLLLRFIAGISVVSTLLVILLRYNTINSVHFCRFMYGIYFWSIDM